MEIKKKKLLKTLRFGIEFEFFTLDERGYITDGADRLIARVKKQHPAIEIKRECAKSMVEVATAPHAEIPSAMLEALEHLEAVIACAAEEKIILYSYATYPGAFTPHFHPTKRNHTQQKIIGEQRFANAGRCSGLHIHFSLPWGVFSHMERVVKPLVRSKNMQALVNSYNLAIAMDPALFTFASSSPLYQGAFLGKDSRVIVYRGGKELSYPGGVHADLPEFGALQPYQSTSTDILHLIQERFTEWGIILKKIGRTIVMFSKHGSILDNVWNPVKINAHGTLEIRGMDINHPDVVVAIAVAIKFIIKEVQQKFVQVVPSNEAIQKPFTFEKGRILIPPDSYVRSTLQPLAAYEGLDNDEVFAYCQALLRLAKQFVPADQAPLLAPLEEMLKNRATTSDVILKIVAQKGWDSKNGLTDAQAAELARELSNEFSKQVLLTKERLRECLK